MPSSSGSGTVTSPGRAAARSDSWPSGDWPRAIVIGESPRPRARSPRPAIRLGEPLRTGAYRAIRLLRSSML